MPLVRPSRRRSAFTLIEILTAMAVVAVLVGLSMGMLRSANQRAALARTRGELAALTQALETYRQHYGDYPQTGAAPLATPVVGADVTVGQVQAILFNALTGVFSPGDFATQRNGPMFIEISKLRVEQTRDYTTRVTANTFGVATGNPPMKPRVAASFIDAWGNRYIYYYRAAAAAGGAPTTQWQLPAYLLYSVGPDGQHTPPNITTGLFNGTTQTTGLNADNVFATP